VQTSKFNGNQYPSTSKLLRLPQINVHWAESRCIGCMAATSERVEGLDCKKTHLCCSSQS
jgi:hypothetical protein